MLLSVFELALVPIAIVLVQPDAVALQFVLDKVAHVAIAIWPCLISFALSFVVFEATLVDYTVAAFKDALPMSFAIDKVTIIVVSVRTINQN